MGFMDKLKEIGSKVGDTVGTGLNTATDNVKKMQEKARLNKEINQLEADINGAYISIGKKCMEEHPDDADFAEFYEVIKADNAKIEELNVQLTALEDKVVCKNCGASVAREAKFCDKCGAKVEIPAPVVEEETEKVVCPTCGESVAAGSKFCEKCGAALVSEEKEEE